MMSPIYNIIVIYILSLKTQTVFFYRLLFSHKTVWILDFVNLVSPLRTILFVQFLQSFFVNKVLLRCGNFNKQYLLYINILLGSLLSTVKFTVKDLQTDTLASTFLGSVGGFLHKTLTSTGNEDPI